MVKNFLKLTIQKEKEKYFGFKYSKTAVKNAATLIFAATLIIVPTVVLKYIQANYNLIFDFPFSFMCLRNKLLIMPCRCMFVDFTLVRLFFS